MESTAVLCRRYGCSSHIDLETGRTSGLEAESISAIFSDVASRFGAWPMPSHHDRYTDPCTNYRYGSKNTREPKDVLAMFQMPKAGWAAFKAQSEPNKRPLLTLDKGGNPNASSATKSGATLGTNVQAGTQPTVPLPHGLGIITVPQGAQRLDVRFNCVTNKLPSGQLTDSLVVNVDVIYNPGCGPNGTKIPTQVSVKSEA
ncbi:hypothetical protein A7U60_g9043 [Sanghuangporus baumii]|uniref:Uncharacterized protein n=1 Tax=Sanghuangporus baumii TaxID=108892 RepID=A0A9Q5N3M8_SANBA|nr:hypothetical protein A7U60_g9043 [Sanghuangporus baumii]